jgi:inner membrane protein
MFNSTHTLVGLGMARSGLERLAPHAIWTAAIAANLPDIDIVTAYGGTASYITFHRGITHSPIGIVFLALALAWTMHWICGGFVGHFTVALLAMASHPFLDFANTYGIRPLFPLYSKWIYGDYLFVLDPYIDLTLIAGLIVGSWVVRRRRAAAAIALTLAAGYMAARLELRNIARRELQVYAEQLPGYTGSAVVPQLRSPFKWNGIIETRDAVMNVDIDIYKGVGRVLVRIPLAHETAVTAAARNTRSAAALLAFARFPVVRVYPESYGHRVEFIDFRFFTPGAPAALAAVVELNPALHVLHEEIAFNQPLTHD